MISVVIIVVVSEKIFKILARDGKREFSKTFDKKNFQTLWKAGGSKLKDLNYW